MRVCVVERVCVCVYMFESVCVCVDLVERVCVCVCVDLVDGDMERYTKTKTCGVGEVERKKEITQISSNIQCISNGPFLYSVQEKEREGQRES